MSARAMFASRNAVAPTFIQSVVATEVSDTTVLAYTFIVKVCPDVKLLDPASVPQRENTAAEIDAPAVKADVSKLKNPL